MRADPFPLTGWAQMRDGGPLVGRQHDLRSTLTGEDVSPNVAKIDGVLGFGSHSGDYKAALTGVVTGHRNSYFGDVIRAPLPSSGPAP